MSSQTSSSKEAGQFSTKRKAMFWSVLVLLLAVIVEGGLRIWDSGQILFVRLAGRLYPTMGLAGEHHYTFDPETGYSLIPKMVDAGKRITTDENGFRVTARPIDPAHESIIFVGDSTVFGWGVEDSACFPFVFSEFPSTAGYNVINMGVPSYSLGHISAVLEKKVPRFRPKIVFVQILWPWLPFEEYSGGDSWKRIDFAFYKQVIPLRSEFQGTKNRWFESRIVKLARNLILRFTFQEEIRRNLVRPGIRNFSISPKAEKSLAMDHVKQLRQAVDRLKKNGVQVVFYIHPYQYTVFHEQYRNLGKVGAELMMHELKAFHPGDYLRSRFSGEPLYIDGSHMTPKGNQVLADYLLKTWLGMASSAVTN